MTRWRAAVWAVGVVVCVAASPVRAADANKVGFLECVHKDAGGAEAKYVLFVPHDYKGDREYPLILFLHGSGETRGGKKQPVEVGLGPVVKKRAKDFPFLVVFPQSQDRTWRADSADGKRALAILDEVRKRYKVDPKRVYLTGLSMGGSGTWSFAAAHPNRWAAIVPICGGAGPDAAAKIKGIPCWAFVGDKDRASLVEGMRNTLRGLWALGAHPNYTEYPDVGHNSWDRAYNTEELYPWLLGHRRP